MDCLQRCYDKGLLIRTTGDIIALSPPLIIQKDHMEQMFEILAGVLRELP
jgi:beta-alanine--pyruvate transaminase